jgi:hypothetical protein
VDPLYVKGLFRRAQAMEALGRLEEAVAAYSAGLLVLVYEALSY